MTQMQKSLFGEGLLLDCEQPYHAGGLTMRGTGWPGLSVAFNRLMTSLPGVLLERGATFTRNSLKHVIQNGALVELAANQFGTSYDPVTGLYGYLPETAATNLALHSEGVLANWTSLNAANAAQTFFGADNAVYIQDNAVLRYVTKSIAVTNGTPYTCSCYVIMDDLTAPVVSNAVTSGDFCMLSQGDYIIPDCTVEHVGNNVYRVYGTRNAGASAIGKYGPAKFTGQSAKGFRVTRIQVETGTYASSYIKTGGATATRAADLLTIPLSNVAGFNAAGYTLYADVRGDTSNATAKIAIGMQAATYENSVYIGDMTYKDIFRVYPNSATPGVNTISAHSAGIRRKLAMSLVLNNCLMSKNGATITADTSTNMPTGMTTLYLGMISSGSSLNTHMFSAKLITKALTQAQLNGLTTL